MKSKAGLNSELNSFLTGRLTMAKELNLPYYISITAEEQMEFCFSPGDLCEV